MFKNKKVARIVAVSIVAVFLLGVFGVAITQSTVGHAANAGTASNVGKVDYQRLVNSTPEFAKFRETMQNEVAQAQKDFDEKSKTMNEKEKQDYNNQLRERLALKEQELRTPVLNQIDAAVKAVADSKGLAVVLDMSNIVYGGQDITDDVVKKLGGK
ncbi:OmpH family outer membrane protein [Sporomusa termitida]|uniref:Outer membrane protein (OmpH-like) n=1 Tax=Sporomusa termitida TaxID=2377 RepID=A0A517DXJ4_9FIRM|nr:OmpH family outer membrane protein [Sporomusa termitida]QDR82080.1 Outer membrane protein (OmpH-like) [Sporomusa termitida]